MKVGIHTNHTNQLDIISEKFETILQYNKIEVLRMNSNDTDFWDIIPTLDLFIYMWGHYDIYRYHAQTILPVIENQYNVKCLPNQSTCWHYDDKIKQFFMMEAKGFPVVESKVFWSKQAALSWIKTEAEFPFVFKLTGGAGSSNVVLVKSEADAIRLANKMFGKGILSSRIPVRDNVMQNVSLMKKLKNTIKPLYYQYIKKQDIKLNWLAHKNYFYLQKFMPDNIHDTRVTTIGDRAFAFRRFVRKNDFRASGSDDWSLDRDMIDIEMVEIAKKVSKEFGFQVMAYDFIYDKDKNPVIVEISYTYGDYPEFSTGYINDDLEWVDGNYWTQYLELIDALHMPDLQQPHIKPTGHYAQVLMND